MGTYINPGTIRMELSRRNRHYVDKSMMISFLNERIDTDDRFLCVSRPRRFGKTMAANMIAAYYSRGCDSHGIFSGLKISSDPSFEEFINNYTVIKLDINGAVTSKGDMTIAQYYSRNVVSELMREYPGVCLSEDISLSEALPMIYEATGDRFVFIIDEYDLPIREESLLSELSDYVSFLVSLFKNEETNHTIALAYLTGILPIIREKVQSKLNNFTEYTMLDAYDMAPYMGFTEDEVRDLALKSGMDYGEIKRWYDGYSIDGIEVYSPKSVIDAVSRMRCGDYWVETSSYEAVTDYISLSLDGLREDVVSMLSGNRVDVNTSLYRNTMSFDSKDDVLTYLIHLGYLAYERSTSSCFIPNNEIRDMWALSMGRARGYSEVSRMISDSRKLLKATWEGDEEAVAEGIERAHMEACSILQYNNEGSFQSVVRLAYFYAKSCYTAVSELPAGKGFADVAFIPYVPDVPAFIVELKKDDTAEAAIAQIREREYPKALDKYIDNLLLVAICYDSKTKKHRCRIEKAVR